MPPRVPAPARASYRRPRRPDPLRAPNLAGAPYKTRGCRSPNPRARGIFPSYRRRQRNRARERRRGELEEEEEEERKEEERSARRRRTPPLLEHVAEPAPTIDYTDDPALPARRRIATASPRLFVVVFFPNPRGRPPFHRSSPSPCVLPVLPLPPMNLVASPRTTPIPLCAFLAGARTAVTRSPLHLPLCRRVALARHGHARPWNASCPRVRAQPEQPRSRTG